MSRRDARHDTGRRWALALLTLVLLAGAAVVAGSVLLGRRSGDDPPAGPAAIVPPPGLDLPALVRPEPVAAPDAPGRPADLAADDVRRAVSRLLGQDELGRHVVASVAPLAGGRPVLSLGAGTAIPASTTKLVTAAGALLALGPDHRFTTSVVADGRRGVVLVGGGDPFLASAPVDPDDPTQPAYPPRTDVVTLAALTAQALREDGRRRVRLGYDDSLFTGPRINPRWSADYVPDGVVAPISALWVDGGRPASGFGRVADPSGTAAAAFARALRRAGIAVVGQPAARRARPDAEPVASVRSAPLAQIVERVLDVSDNEAAEVLSHHVGLATSGVGTFAAGIRGTTRALRGVADLGPGVLYDGSGLSRDNRLAPGTIVELLQAAAAEEHPDLRPLLTGLPVAGFTGSLTFRFEDTPPAGRGRVRAKTGTLTGVSGLAGIALDRDGNAMAFALIADRVKLEDTLDAREALDDAAAALGDCRCSA